MEKAVRMTVERKKVRVGKKKRGEIPNLYSEKIGTALGILSQKWRYHRRTFQFEVGSASFSLVDSTRLFSSGSGRTNVEGCRTGSGYRVRRSPYIERAADAAGAAVERLQSC